MTITDSIKTEIAFITMLNFAALAINIAVFMLLFIKANKNASLKAFFIVQLSMIIWLTGKIMKTTAPTEGLRWLAIVAYYVGICLLEAAFLDFSYLYSKGRPLEKPVRIAIYTLALLQLFVVATNPYHHLFYSLYTFQSDEFGVLFYVHVAIEYSFILTGLFYCRTKFRRQVGSLARLPRHLISAAILLPIFLNLIYISRVLEKVFDAIGLPIFDITPIVFTWSLLMFLYATYKYQFFSLTPILKHEIAHRLDTSVLIINDGGKILFANERLHRTLNTERDPGALALLAAQIDCSKPGCDCSICFGEKYFMYSVSAVRMPGGFLYIVAFNDLTVYQKTQDELAEQNRRLEAANVKLENQIALLKQTSQAGARNYIARELHDIVGHSLVVTMKLLEVCKLDLGQDRNRVRTALEKAGLSVQTGLEQIKSLSAQTDLTAAYDSVYLQRELRRMLKVIEVGGMQVNCYFRGKADRLDEAVFDTVQKISTELVTNTLKHSRATSILISVAYGKNNIQVRYMDNGIGVGTIIKGNGLSGIDTRLEAVGGSAEYASGVNEGFSAIISIPLKTGS